MRALKVGLPLLSSWPYSAKKGQMLHALLNSVVASNALLNAKLVLVSRVFTSEGISIYSKIEIDV